MSHHQKPVKPQPPSDKIYLRAGHANEAKDYERLQRSISKQPFVSQLDILLSTSSSEKPSLDNVPTVRDVVNSATFQHARVNPAKLLTPDFMTSYIRNGSLVALSCDDGSGDILAIDGSGHLVLSLSKDTYQLLGIVGNTSKFGSKGQKSYIAVDLREMHMRDGKPGYERLKLCLSKMGDIDMMFSFYNSTGSPQLVRFPDDIASKTLKTRISTSSCSLDVDAAHNKIGHLQKAISSKKRKFMETDTCKDLACDLLDNIGLASLQHSRGGKLVLSLSIEGFLQPAMIAKLASVLLTMPGLSFLSMTTHSMPHSPISEAIERPNGKSARKRPTGNVERDTSGTSLDGTIMMIAGTDVDKAYIFCGHS